MDVRVLADDMTARASARQDDSTHVEPVARTVGLKELHCLRPSWITGVGYRVLEHKCVLIATTL